VDDLVAVWKHDLASTSSYADLWPSLLVLALLLWPLDVALRRVSIGRRELVAARAWVRGRLRRRGVTGPRTADVAGMLASRERAAGAAARSALLRPEGAPPRGPAPAPTATAVEATASSPEPVHERPATEPSASRSAAAPTAASPEPADTIARLREAKRRARER